MEKLTKLFLVIMFLLSTTIQAQTQRVTGQVTDPEGMEIIGANVFIKGDKSKGCITDMEGKYSLTVNHPSTDILVFSYIGMEKKEVAIKSRKVVNTTLENNAVMLNEVVAIGYGTSKRKDLTGSVVSVKSEDLLKVPTSNVTEALAGRVAGVQITQSEGAPGSNISIRVRGGISITQSNEPLYIIDGFPSEGGLQNLDPSDIETIDILKDASSTAIYGSRGANGVVVITTKKGIDNGKQFNIAFDSYIGYKKIARTLPVLSPKEFVLLDYERSLGNATGEEEMELFNKIYGTYSDIDKNYNHRKGVNWQEEALGRNATTQNYRVSLSGTNKNIQYKLGYSYFKDEGAMVYSGNNKHNISFSINHKATDRLKINARINYDQIKIYGMGTSENSDRFNKLQHILQYRPTIGITGNDEDLIKGEDPLIMDDSGNVMQNPLISASEELNDREYRTLQINGGLTYEIAKGLTFRNSTGMRYQNARFDKFFGAESITAKRSSINGSIRNRENGSFQTSNVLTYDFAKESHHFTIMGGQEWVSTWNRNFQASASNFPNDDIGLNDLSLGATPGTPQSSVNYDNKLLSFFGRLNYNYKDKYLVTASIRADGSSKFGPNNKWGIFPAASAAWRLGEEKIIKKLNLFSDLKLRVGYGLAGNNRIASYSSLGILSSVTYPSGNAVIPGYAASQIPNEDLKWESNKTFNVGVDFGFFNQRLTISPEFYINRSSNLLLNSRLPFSSGFKSMIRNIGETENKGFDLTITSVNIENKDFRWTTNFNISHNKNTIKALADEQFFLAEAKFGYNDKTHIIEVGKAVGQFYGYQTIGLYQVDDFNYDAATKKYSLKEGIPYHGNKANVKPGMWKFADNNNDKVINEDDKKIIGNANPKFYGGLNNTFNYKDFDLSVFITFNYGNDIFNATKLTNTKAGLKNQNILSEADNSKRWVTINEKGNIISEPNELKKINQNKSVAAWYDLQIGDNYVHSWAIEDGSYIRLSNITLGYTLPKKWTKKVCINQLRLYATASNLFTLTNYSGYDPEVSTKGNSITPGIDFGAYPRSKSFVVGVNLNF